MHEDFQINTKQSFTCLFGPQSFFTILHQQRPATVSAQPPRVVLSDELRIGVSVQSFTFRQNHDMQASIHQHPPDSDLGSLTFAICRRSHTVLKECFLLVGTPPNMNTQCHSLLVASFTH